MPGVEEYYDLAYDRRKNRISVTIRGYWPSVDVAPDFVDQWQEQLGQVQRGFTVLVDTRSMKVPPADVLALHRRIQEMVIQAGARKRAEIASESVTTQLSTKRISSESGIALISRRFTTREEAETWLDQPDE